MRTLLKSTFIATALAFGVVGTTATLPAFAADEVNLASGLAVQGYDVIAYRTDAGPTLGSIEYTATHDGAVYRFANQENLETFQADPARYVPAYGGFCAFGVTKEKKVKIDPEAYSIVDDVLYLNYSKRIQNRWEKKQADYITEADTIWSEIRTVDQDDL